MVVQATYVLGLSQFGKSTYLLREILACRERVEGCCVVDPHRTLNEKLFTYYRQLGYVIHLDVEEAGHAFGLNPLHCSDPDDVLAAQKTCEQLLTVFETIWRAQIHEAPQMRTTLRAVIATLIANPPYNLYHASDLLTNKAFCEQLVEQPQHRLEPKIVRWWRHYYKLSRHDQQFLSASSLNKLTLFDSGLAKYITCQAKQTIDIPQHMNHRRELLLVSLSPTLDDTTKLIGTLIIHQILYAALDRAKQPKAEPYTLFCDELDRFATPEFVRLFKEPEKFGLRVFAAQQVNASTPEDVRVGVLAARRIVAYRLHPDDAAVFGDRVFKPEIKMRTVGQEPIRTFTPRPLEALWQGGGHENPAIRETATRLRSVATLLDGTQQELYALMKGEPPVIHDDQEIFRKVLYEFSPIGYHKFIDGKDYVGRRDGDIDEEEFEALSGVVAAAAANNGTFPQSVDKYMHYIYQKQYKYYFEGKDLDWLAETFKPKNFDFLPFHRQIEVSMSLGKQYALPEDPEERDRRAREHAQDSHMLKVAKEECEKIEMTVRDLRMKWRLVAELGAQLAREPILIETNRFKPLEEEESIANSRDRRKIQLRELPKFTAYVQDIAGEGLVAMPPPPDPAEYTGDLFQFPFPNRLGRDLSDWQYYMQILWEIKYYTPHATIDEFLRKLEPPEEAATQTPTQVRREVTSQLSGTSEKLPPQKTLRNKPLPKGRGEFRRPDAGATPKRSG